MNTINHNSGRLGSTTYAQVRRDSVRLAFALAKNAGDRQFTSSAITEALASHDPRSAGFVVINALEHVVNDILSSAFDTLQLTGFDPRQALAAIQPDVEAKVEAQLND